MTNECLNLVHLSGVPKFFSVFFIFIYPPQLDFRFINNNHECMIASGVITNILAAIGCACL
jgi:hypothetical protein